MALGKIATKFFDITSKFEYRKLCYTFNPDKHENLKEYNVEFVSLEEIMKQSDYILIVIPYSDKTHNLINKDLLEISKENQKIINVSRLKILDIENFIKMLNEGKYKDSLIDCFPEEIDLSQIENVNNINFTPHITGISQESIERMDLKVINTLVELLKGENINE